MRDCGYIPVRLWAAECGSAWFPSFPARALGATFIYPWCWRDSDCQVSQRYRGARTGLAGSNEGEHNVKINVCEKAGRATLGQTCWFTYISMCQLRTGTRLQRAVHSETLLQDTVLWLQHQASWEQPPRGTKPWPRQCRECSRCAARLGNPKITGQTGPGNTVRKQRQLSFHRPLP